MCDREAENESGRQRQIIKIWQIFKILRDLLGLNVGFLELLEDFVRPRIKPPPACLLCELHAESRVARHTHSEVKGVEEAPPPPLVEHV